MAQDCCTDDRALTVQRGKKLVGHHLIQPHAIERREQDWISGSRPSEMRTSHVREPREMSCPAFRAIRHLRPESRHKTGLWCRRVVTKPAPPLQLALVRLGRDQHDDHS